MMTKDRTDSKPPKKPRKSQDDQLKIDELTLDLQRTRADFEYYRKRMETEKDQARSSGKAAAVVSLLPVIDSIERAVVHVPDDLVDHPWVRGIASLTKQLDKTLSGLDLKRIES